MNKKFKKKDKIIYDDDENKSKRKRMRLNKDETEIMK